jgi:hypothetical protein
MDGPANMGGWSRAVGTDRTCVTMRDSVDVRAKVRQVKVPSAAMGPVVGASAVEKTQEAHSKEPQSTNKEEDQIHGRY